MAEQLKHYFNEELVRSIASELGRAYPPLRQGAFVDSCMAELVQLELMARGARIAEVMYDHLQRPFATSADIIVASLGPELTRTDDLVLAPFHYLPHVLFVQKYGLDDFELAMRPQYELTKRFSAQSSIRAFVVKYP